MECSLVRHALDVVPGEDRLHCRLVTAIAVLDHDVLPPLEIRPSMERPQASVEEIGRPGADDDTDQRRIPEAPAEREGTGQRPVLDQGIECAPPDGIFERTPRRILRRTGPLRWSARMVEEQRDVTDRAGALRETQHEVVQLGSIEARPQPAGLAQRLTRHRQASSQVHGR